MASETAAQAATNGTSNGSVKESNVDVLIIGSGPAGIMAAAWMAHIGVPTRIVDKRNTKIFCGQADGLQPRSFEIFDSLGFGDRAWKETNHLIEICMWNPGEDGVIRRSGRIPDTIPGLSRMQQSVVQQGRIERFFLDNIKKYSKDTIRVERSTLPESLTIDEAAVNDENAYPVTVRLRTLSEEEATPPQQPSATRGPNDGIFRSNLIQTDDEEDLISRSAARGGETEVVHAKYVIGCDGARSWTRRALGDEFDLHGEATDYIWGVMDIIPVTDFPDIRMRCAIHSAEHGSLMVIPRENKMVRLYIQLKEVTPDASGRADRSKITPELIFGAAQKILSPYKIDYTYCDWWTAYQIGQRVGKRFSAHDRVFLAGDAVHTHSPKAGQGMNISMADTYNLGWKIGLVAKGLAKRDILATYQTERRRVAQDLIDFDRRFSRLFSGRPAKDVLDTEGISMDDFKDAFEKGNLFASGLMTNYGPSAVIVKPGDAAEQGDGTDVTKSAASAGLTEETFKAKQALATGLPVGMRFNSFKVLNQASARPVHLQELLKADGRFRLVVFAGNVLAPAQKARLDALCAKLDSPSGFLRRSTRMAAPPAHTQRAGLIDSVIEVLTVHSAKRVDTELLRDLPDILHPLDPEFGWDYDKVYVDDESYHEGYSEAYKNYGVDRERGCIVAVRPDQHVAWVGDLEDYDQLEAYFEGILRLPPAGETNGHASGNGVSIPVR